MSADTFDDTICSTETESEEDSFSQIYDAKVKLRNNESHLDSNSNAVCTPINTYYKIIINNNNESSPINCVPDNIQSENDQPNLFSGVSSESWALKHNDDSISNLELGEEEIMIISSKSQSINERKRTNYSPNFNILTNLEDSKRSKSLSGDFSKTVSARESECQKTAVRQQSIPAYHQITDKAVSCCTFKYTLHEEITSWEDQHYYPKHASFNVIFCGFVIIFIVVGVIFTAYNLSTLSDHCGHYGYTHEYPPEQQHIDLHDENVDDMIKKIEDEKYQTFWNEYSSNIKLGVIEYTANRTRLAKLLRFVSSNGKFTSLAEYVGRMKDKQESIFYMAGSSKNEVENSPFIERLLKKGYEVLMLTDAMDEYAVSALPEFEGKKFQNVEEIAEELTEEEEEEVAKVDTEESVHEEL